ncbi:hypothetical protein [Cobetia sp. ICG0124]|uniref:hypothetical protein n=1 Tax=Cobetia sp. ICG0124 TaxID=2053669 RepID=UPI001F0CA3AF|nr:hypothetical protein [Cobetia sp. ICG0124]
MANVAPEAYDNVADLEEGIATGDSSTTTGNVLTDAEPDTDTDGGNDNDGTLNWTFDSSSVAGEAFDHLAVGESLVLDFTVVVTDSQGATAEQVVSASPSMAVTMRRSSPSKATTARPSR